MIIVDDRERMIARILHEKGQEIKVMRLDIGDFLIGDVCIERKTIRDFVNSIIDNRLFIQIKNMKECCERQILIVEGEEDIYSQRNVHPNAIRGAIASIALDFNISMVETKNPEETANMLISIEKRISKEKKEIELHKRKPISTQGEQLYIVSSLPSIGTQLAKNLLKKFGNIKSIFNASEKELMKVEGIGKEKAKKIYEIINKEYSEED